jgi:DNA-binding MarR family transcriptional regulator
MTLDHRPLKHLLGYSLVRASLHTDKVFHENLGGPLQLRQVEFTILSLVDANEDVTAKKLSDALSISAPNMSVMLDRLETRGLLKRVPHGTDKRASLLQLTSKGRALLARAARVAERMEEQVLARLTQGELAILMELLEKVAAGPQAGVKEAPDATR